MKSLALCLALAATACTTVESIAISQLPAESQRREKIEGYASSPVIFAIPFGTGFIDAAHDQLVNRCPGGAIEGVLTKFQRTNYFLGLVEAQQVFMEGYCVKGGAAGGGKGKHHQRRAK